MNLEVVRSTLIAVLPKIAIDWMRGALNAFRRWRHAKHSAREVFSEVYAKRQWGPNDFNSGPGSHGEPAQVYAECVLEGHNIKSVVDLGGGDFEVGMRITPGCERYIGIDVVPALIDALCLQAYIEHLWNCRNITASTKVTKISPRHYCRALPEIEGKPNMDIEHGSNTRIER